MVNTPLNNALTARILAYLGTPVDKPDIRSLNRLIQAYTRSVPWESVFRIVKRRSTEVETDCPRWPEEFWQDALTYGGGGTCFESSLAFFSLLTTVGYDGYLTINDMGAQHACHAAIVVVLQGCKYLVDITIPVHCALPLDPDRITRRHCTFHTYTVRPEGDHRYRIQRSHHSIRDVFTLVDIPVDERTYRVAVEKDYGAGGYFLDRVVIVKVVSTRVWTFNSFKEPYALEGLNRAGKVEVALPAETLAQSLAEHFRMNADRIAMALAYVQQDTNGRDSVNRLGDLRFPPTTVGGSRTGRQVQDTWRNGSRGGTAGTALHDNKIGALASPGPQPQHML